MTAYRMLFRQKGTLMFQTGTFYANEANAIGACEKGNAQDNGYEYAYVAEDWP